MLFLSLGTRERVGAGGGRTGALVFYLVAKRTMGRGPGRAGALAFLLGARGRAGVGSRTSGSMRPSRLCSSHRIAACPRLLLHLAGAGAGSEGIFWETETPSDPGGGAPEPCFS